MGEPARAIWFLTGALCVAAVFLLLRPPPPAPGTLQGVRDAIILPDNTGVIPAGAVTNLYPLIYERVAVPKPVGRAGAVAAAGPHTLLMTRQGRLLRLAGDRFAPIDMPPPFDLAPMEAALPIARIRQRMGVYDMAIQASEGDWRLFVSYAHHDPDGACLTLRVATLTLSDAEIEQGTTASAWRDIFASTPCIDTTGNKVALLGGGAIAVKRDGKILLGVGTFGLNAAGDTDVLAFLRSDDTDYGKLVEIDPETGASRHYAKGMRDPTSVIVTPDGAIWSTEQGPRGGDELNLIRDGSDYGWPLSTHGVNYGQWVWPLDPDTGRHSRFEPPVWAWVPSPAISSAIMIGGDGFPNWRGDVMASSLKAGHLYRLRLRNGRVAIMEPIFVGDRIRDLAETSDGALIVLLDRFDFALKITNANRSAAGARFKSVPYQVTYCTGCHQVKPGDPGIAAPLTGVIGRKVAAVEGLEWSEALTKAGGTWTRDRVAAFLEHPQRFAPGTTHPKLDLAPFRLFQLVEWLADNP